MTGIFDDEVSEYTTITVSKDTAKKLKEFFSGKETYNYVITFLLNYHDEKTYRI